MNFKLNKKRLQRKKIVCEMIYKFNTNKWQKIIFLKIFGNFQAYISVIFYREKSKSNKNKLIVDYN